MAYNSNIPQPNNLISQSQGDILDNFTALNTSNSVNHVAYNDANQGKHKFMQMPEEVANPATAGNEGALVVKEAGALAELFYVPESNGAAVQMTSGGISASAASGYSFLPGGMLIQWGTAAGTSAGTANVFPVSFTGTAYTVVVTPLNAGAITGWNVFSKSNSQFICKTTVAGPITLNYIAIGKR